MQTLAQIRARNALGRKIAKGQKEGNVLSGFSTLVKIDGLLAALAFSCEKNKNGEIKHKGEYFICEAIAAHLKDEQIRITGRILPRELAEELASGDATKLRRATAEALAYLNYLKRFAS